MDNFSKPYYKLNNGHIVYEEDLRPEDLPYITSHITSNLYINPLESLDPSDLAKKINEIINVMNEKWQ